MFTTFLTLLLLALLGGGSKNAEACSSRAVPKTRPSTASSSTATAAASSSLLPTTAPTARTTTTRRWTTTTSSTTTTTPRPNITFPTYKCPTTYDAWYCLNDATCFSVKIGDSIMYNCECAIGFMGPRCEYKELDGSYLPKRPRPLLEKASIASGATCALLFMLFICLTLYLRSDYKTKAFEMAMAAEHAAADAFDEDEAMVKAYMLNRESESASGTAAIKSSYDCRYCCCNESCCLNSDSDYDFETAEHVIDDDDDVADDGVLLAAHGNDDNLNLLSNRFWQKYAYVPTPSFAIKRSAKV